MNVPVSAEVAYANAAAPTVSNASSLITMALDTHASEVQQRDGYMRYIALRPRAERHGEHGLFGRSKTVSLDAALKELEAHGGNVWTIIYSLRREDAARLGHDHAEGWRDLLRRRQTDLAAALKIQPDHLRWYAAFHDEGEHPHVHVMAWSDNPDEGYLSKDGLLNIQSKLTNDIFHGELQALYALAKLLQEQGRLRVAEYMPTADAAGNPIEQRHIASVFKLVQELVGPGTTKGNSQFQELMEKLPPNHKARWFAGSALNSAEQAMASVLSTVLSRLNAFLDSEMEQILCFDTAIDAEKKELEAAITRQTWTVRTADTDEDNAKAGGITDTGEQTMGVGADIRLFAASLVEREYSPATIAKYAHDPHLHRPQRARRKAAARTAPPDTLTTYCAICGTALSNYFIIAFLVSKRSPKFDIIQQFEGIHTDRRRVRSAICMVLSPLRI